jgi:hypothetical protein
LQIDGFVNGVAQLIECVDALKGIIQNPLCSLQKGLGRVARCPFLEPKPLGVRANGGVQINTI